MLRCQQAVLYSFAIQLLSESQWCDTHKYLDCSTYTRTCYNSTLAALRTPRLTDGLADGLVLGLADGDAVGEADGDSLGLAVGLAVGLVVGLAVEFVPPPNLQHACLHPTPFTAK